MFFCDSSSMIYIGRPGNVHLENYDDGAYIHLVNSTKIYTDDMIELLSNMEQIYGEIEGVTEYTLKNKLIINLKTFIFVILLKYVDLQNCSIFFKILESDFIKNSIYLRGV